jgi:pimeloyl-ACP methyl ester carboxylesterase
MPWSPTAEGKITLHDGRTLAYAERGPADGQPIFVFHGTPGSRLEQHLPTETYDRMGVRYLTADRPGMGLSDPLAGRTLLDWANDVAQLADALELERFPVLGCSGGGPYAAACGYRLPDRVTAVGIVSGSAEKPWPGQHDRVMLDSPDMDTSWAADFRRDPRAFLERVFTANPAVPSSDRRIFERPEVRESLVTSVAESFRQGTDGPVYDNYLDYQPWGFDPRHIDTAVYVWHGEDDANVSIEQARLLASAIPGSEAVFYAAEGHLLVYEREEDILNTLLEKPGTPAPP